eukprot:3698730-Amphidinium_carterae.1
MPPWSGWRKGAQQRNSTGTSYTLQRIVGSDHTVSSETLPPLVRLVSWNACGISAALSVREIFEVGADIVCIQEGKQLPPAELQDGRLTMWPDGAIAFEGGRALHRAVMVVLAPQLAMR